MNKINLIEEIIDTMPKGLDKLETMYYIYIKTCQIFSYDVRYNDSPYIIAEYIKNNYQNIKRVRETDVVCTVWAKIYMDLLKKVGVKDSLVHRNGHSWVEGHVNNLIIYSDPTYGAYTDFARVKHHDSVQHFYPVTSEKTDKLPIMDTKADFNIDELNKRIGYEVTEEETFSFLEKSIADMDTLKEKVEFILKYAKLTGYDQFSDWQYIKNLLRVLLRDNHCQIIFGALTKINEDYTFLEKDLIVVDDDDKYHYYLLSDTIDLVSKEELIENAKDGYCMRTLYKPIGLEYPLKFTRPKASLHYYLNVRGFKNKTKEKCYNITR